MYKARVEAVSGTKILAGGKWLQCIGNKTFHVGELAWTDGRCAYGNHYTPQQPLVITATQDEGIPILSAMYPTSLLTYLECYTYTKQLKSVGSQQPYQQAPYRFYHLINDRKGNAYYTRALLSEGHVPFDVGVIDANIDNSNNFYTITLKYSDEKTFYLGLDDFNLQLRRLTGGRYIEITKNGDVVDTFDPKGYIIEAYNQVKANCSAPPGEISSNVGDTGASASADFWGGFIENENHWAILMHVHGGADISTREYVGLGYHNVPQYSSNHHLRRESGFFLVTQDGATQLHHLRLGYFNYGAKWYLSGETEVFIPISIETDATDEGMDAPDTKIPLQDGYYYKINSFRTYPITDIYKGDTFYACMPVNLSLFAPDDKKVMDGDFLLEEKITICKVGGERYLIGVGLDWNAVSEIPEKRWQYYEETYGMSLSYEYIRPGLYLCEKGALTQISDKSCMNHRLRPMKKIKSWQNRIRDLPTE